MFPWRREEKKGCVRRENEELEEGMQMVMALGNPGTAGLVGSTAHQPASPFPLRLAEKQAVGIIVDSPALRDGPPLDPNRGQCEETGREPRGEKRRVRKDDCMTSVPRDQDRMALPSDVPPRCGGPVGGGVPAQTDSPNNGVSG